MNGGFMEHPVEAQVIDSRHLKLKKPINITPGSTVMITIEATEAIAEDQEWYLLSTQGLNEAYNEEEPNYSVDMIKIPNPEYLP
jgi:hypothetical protein